MKNFNIVIILLSLFSACAPQKEKELSPSETLWYDEPAAAWAEALPVGNGKLGAMVYGGTNKEVIQFNEETLWTGQPNDYSHKGAYQYLDTLRQLLWEGKQAEAQKLANKKFMSQPLRQLSYQPFGNIILDFSNESKAVNYKRELNLEDAISKVSYEINEVKYKREVFVSEPHQALALAIESDKSGAVNFTATMDSPHANYDVSVVDDVIILKGRANDYGQTKKPNQNNETTPKSDKPESKITFEAHLKVITDGELVKNKGSIQIKNASSVTLLLVAATNFVNYNDISANPQERCEEYLSALDGKTFDQLKSAHIKDYQELYSRVKFDLGNSEISSRPTNERLSTFEQDQDPSFVALLFQYGRYLLITSSRVGTQPANLQGIWNDQLNPSWDSKYTININTEMNYWPAEITNLSELTGPITQMVEDLSSVGKTVANEHYNLEGWVTHHNTDIWRGAAPINNANHGIWVVGGAWLCQHLWWHYEFSGDKAYLENKAYPIMKEASRFFVDYLIPHKDKPEWLISGPGNSPENGGLVMAPTMDHQIIRNLFANTIEAAEILGVDVDFVKILKEKRARIAPNQIGQYGQLQEWFEDKDDPENKHRHVSHLWGLHPGNEIHPLTTPELAEACKVTLSQRGDGGTGWSRAWKINFWARLLDGDHSFLLLKNLMVPAGSKSGANYSAGGLYPNLFDAHPPFQIDGNFGATSGVTEMLLQSHLRDDEGDYFQDILPALPSQLPFGKIKGIKGRGGFEFTIEWKNGKLIGVDVKSILGNELNLRYSGKSIKQETTGGETYSFQMEDFG